VLTLHRQKVSATAVQGELSLDGSHYGWTLERPYTDPEHACIPVGTYPLSVGWSNHFQCDMVHINDVPGRAGILIHGGNHVTDSLGCVMVGQNHNVALAMVDTCSALVKGLKEYVSTHPGSQIQVVDDTELGA
jgi:hypothetical protein